MYFFVSPNWIKTLKTKFLRANLNIPRSIKLQNIHGAFKVLNRGTTD